MNVVCIIPARGGSKGIPGKNIKKINGKPLVCWSIQQALDSQLVNLGVYVSSDSQDILRIAEQAGAHPIIRPAELSGDTASSESALIHTLNTIQQQHQVDLVVFLQCTSPIRKPGDIDKAIRCLLENEADSLLSVTKVKDYFVWGYQHGQGHSLNFDYQNRKRRQELPTQYLENGSIYVFRPEILNTKSNRLGGRIAIYEMDKACAVQVDDDEEFLICEALMKGNLC